ncbi:MAG: hypothetical protein ACD_20C00045G0001 [uncultured bacterium]|nr:MAG: hypothetical protein ACD_20C00045G0001 [uncultured bacterium]
MGLLGSVKKAVKGVFKGAKNIVGGAVKSVANIGKSIFSGKGILGSIGNIAKSIFSKGGIFGKLLPLAGLAFGGVGLAGMLGGGGLGSIFSGGGLSSIFGGISSKLGIGSIFGGSTTGNIFGNVAGSFLGDITKLDKSAAKPASFDLNPDIMPTMSLSNILQTSTFGAPVSSSILSSNPFSPMSSVDHTLRLANSALPAFQAIGNLRI